MLGDFQHKACLTSLNFEGVKDWWQVVVELDVNDGTNYSNNLCSCGGKERDSKWYKFERDKNILRNFPGGLLTLPLAVAAAAALAA